MSISIIVPTYNEGQTISDLITHLKKHASPRTDLLVVDGGSSDDTIEKARTSGARVLLSPQKGRASQMNLGAKHTTGDILYFIHADSLPPASFPEDIHKAVENGHEAGCYRFEFNSDRWLLKINAYCTRFDRIMCRGGDQTLFITRSLFGRLGGYRNDFKIMEDYDLIERAQKATSFKIIPKNVTVSPRKYENNGYLKVQIANFVVFMMYFGGCSQDKLVHAYKRLIYHPKF